MTYLAALSGSCELMEVLVDELTEFGFSPEDPSIVRCIVMNGAICVQDHCVRMYACLYVNYRGI